MNENALGKTEARLLNAPLGRHIILELFTDDRELLNDEKRIMAMLEKAAEEGNVTVVGRTSATFNPHGVTAVLLLAESHISIHTWPEYGYAAVDIFTCGGDADKVLEAILRESKAKKHIILHDIPRGEF